jgi:hypothetical protein
MRVAYQAMKGTTEMKSLTKAALRAIPESHVQISLPLQGVLQDVQNAFVGLCVHAGKQVLTAMMEADRAALCGPKGARCGTPSRAGRDHPQQGRAGRSAHRHPAASRARR